jgi:hypothetical protein
MASYIIILVVIAMVAVGAYVYGKQKAEEKNKLGK